MSEYPKLMWAPDGREFTVGDEVEQAARMAEGFRLAVDVVAATPLEVDPAPDPSEVDVVDADQPKKKAKK